jgi:hypothetical protein
MSLNQKALTICCTVLEAQKHRLCNSHFSWIFVILKLV